MNRDPILFRVDGTVQAGWERLGRCITLAAAIQRRRRPSYFLSQLEPTSVLAQQIKRGGHEWLEADGPAGTEDDLSEVIQEIRRLQPAAVVVDIANVRRDYLAELASTGVLVVSLDHQAHVAFPSHLVVNPLLGPGRDDYEHDPATQLLLGPRYAVVRPEIRRVRPLRSTEPALPFRAMVALGEDDPNDQTAALAKQLLAIGKIDRVDMVVRPWHPRRTELQDLAAAHPDRLDLAIEPAEVSARLSRCHFAVTNGGGWSVELACIGMPQLLIVQNEAHWPTAQRLDEEGAAICLGWHENVSTGTVRQAVLTLMGDQAERRAMARSARKLIDGRGPDRLVTALEVMLHPSRTFGSQLPRAA